MNRREIPGGLALAGAAVVAISLLNWIIPPRGAVGDYLVTIGLGLVFIAIAAFLRRAWVPAPALPWIWVTLANLLVALLLLQFYFDPRPVNLLWVVAVIVTFLPIVGDWAAAWMGAGTAVALTALAVWAWSVPDAIEYVLIATSAVTIGLILLRRKLATIDALADAHAVIEDSARTDPLTRVFNRRGLLDHLAPLSALAQRTEQPLFAAFIDVRGLKAANDQHGHDFGDSVIVCVADALRSSVRASDVLGRWGGDEFVVVGMGEAQTPEVLEERVRRTALEEGVDPAKWAAGVTVGIACCPPGEQEPVDLIKQADAAMYARRRALGDSGR